MARNFRINIDVEKSNLLVILQKAVQSANLNFLIGSGCSFPAVPPLGNIEQEVQKQIDAGKSDEAEKLVFDFLKPFLESSIKLDKKLDGDLEKTVKNYQLFIDNISQLLFRRNSNILPRQATIFSTNYDLFVEKAFEEIKMLVRLNDGFNRSPLLTNSFLFSSSEFFNSIYNNGNLYNYQVQIPSINLVKIHGSLSWQIDGDKIRFSVSDLSKLYDEYGEILKSLKADEINKFNQKFSIVLPRKEKFKDAILNETYYELLRIYANELDRENTILLVMGFSFADEHILKITKRALKNPTLRIVIFCYDKDEKNAYTDKFCSFNNVFIIYSEVEKIDFDRSSSIIKEVLPVEFKIGPKV
jgi:hypothetical protein